MISPSRLRFLCIFLTRFHDPRARRGMKKFSTVQSAVKQALRKGTLHREPCIICGDKKSHGHHEDYLKPANVTWLCRKHHSERHKEMRKNKQDTHKNHYEEIQVMMLVDKKIYNEIKGEASRMGVKLYPAIAQLLKLAIDSGGLREAMRRMVAADKGVELNPEAVEPS